MEIGRCKRTNILIPLLELPGTVKFQETESKQRLPGSRGRGDFCDGYRDLVWENEKFWEMDNGDACTTAADLNS